MGRVEGRSSGCPAARRHAVPRTTDPAPVAPRARTPVLQSAPAPQRAPWLLTAVAFAYAGMLLFLQLGAMPLLDPDEGRNAQVAREVQESGSWLVPTYDGMPYLDKPIFYFKAVALSFDLFGVGETAARLPSAMFGLALLVLLFAFCRRAYGLRVAAITVLVMASTPLFFALARAVIFDMPLAFFVTGSILAVFSAEQRCGPSRRLLHAVGAAAAGMAVLVKGPVGAIVPALVLIGYHVAGRRPGFLRRFFSPLNILVLLAVVLPWFLALVRERPDFLSYGLGEETLRRYSTAAFRRTAPIYYYGPILLGVFFPWSALLPEGAVSAWKRRREWMEQDRLFVIWAVVVLLFFTTSRSKLPAYILPGVLALAVLTARLFARAWEDPRGWAARVVLRGALVVGGLSTIMALFLLANVLAPERMREAFDLRGPDFERSRPLFLPAGISLLLVALSSAVARFLRRPGLVLVLFVLLPVLVCGAGWDSVREFGQGASARKLVEAMAPLPGDAGIACLECLPPGLPFYARRPVTLVSADGHEFTSNYLLYRLRRGEPRPEVLVHPAELASFVERREGPLYLLTKKKDRARVDSLAASSGVELQALAPGWWGLLLPAQPTRPVAVASP